jgi:hypothetical protein
MPKFMLPEGVEVPEGLAKGDSFQVVATLVLGDGGNAELIEVDGTPLKGYESKGGEKKKGGMEVEEEEPRLGGFVEEVMARSRM